MPQKQATRRSAKRTRVSKVDPRYTVALESPLADDVARYADSLDTSMSKAIATLVRIGLESQAQRKREFFQKLRQNLASNDPSQEDRLVDEFRSLILGQ